MVIKYLGIFFPVSVSLLPILTSYHSSSALPYSILPLTFWFLYPSFSDSLNTRLLNSFTCKAIPRACNGEKMSQTTFNISFFLITIYNAIMNIHIQFLCEYMFSIIVVIYLLVEFLGNT